MISRAFGKPARGLMFGLSLPLDPFSLHTSIKGPDEPVRMLIWAFATLRCDDHENKTLCTAPDIFPVRLYVNLHEFVNNCWH